jgi:2-haloacid dehalogenase
VLLEREINTERRSPASIRGVNTVVFDLGGVLVDWDPRYLLRKVMPGREAEMEAILADVINHEWNLQRDTGDSWPDAMAELERRYPQWADIFRIYDERWVETIGGDKPETVEILHELISQDVRLLALSNWSAEKFPLGAEQFDWLRLFEGVVVSGRIGMVKPNKDIFDYLLNTYDVEAGDIFFIDDNEPNVIAARSYGIHTHHFRDADALRSELVSEGLLKEVAAPAS